MPIFKSSAIVGSTILLFGAIWFGATPATAAVIPEQRIALINGRLAGYLQSRTQVPILLPQRLPPSLSAMPLNLTVRGAIGGCIACHNALPPFSGILVAAPAPHGPSVTNYGEAYALAFADGSSVYSVNPFYVQPSKYASPSPAAMDSPDNLAATANSLVPIP
ncbi:MAG: hypothetical protein ACYCVB_06165 [Bacilli bacterium]